MTEENQMQIGDYNEHVALMLIDHGYLPVYLPGLQYSTWRQRHAERQAKHQNAGDS